MPGLDEGCPTCGEPPLRGPASTASPAPPADLATTLAELRAQLPDLRREALTWLLAVPPAAVILFLLATSSALWTEPMPTVDRHGAVHMVIPGEWGRSRLIVALLAYTLLPPFVSWLVRRRELAHVAAPAAEPADGGRSRLAAWTVRVGVLLWLVLLALDLLRRA